MRWVFGWCALVLAGFAGLKAAEPVRRVRPPFFYPALAVQNSCFVESVHFYDFYYEKKLGGNKTWARVLEWGNQEGDLKLGVGHAVVVFVAKNRAWNYDINFGFVPMEIALDRVTDVTDAGPVVFSKYPQFKPVFARYRDDYAQTPPKKRPEYLFYHKNRDLRDATHVAYEMARFRPASVFEFSYPENGQVKESAGAAFYFGGRFCIYYPSRGTHISKPYFDRVEDLDYLRGATVAIFPGATTIRWQDGGYLFFPPKRSPGSP